MSHKEFLVPEGKRINLADIDANFTGNYTDKKAAEAELKTTREKIAALQDKMYAQNTQSLVVIFQAMDAAGKDSTIKHVFTGVNPLGLQIAAFKPPSEEERDHDFLWRATKLLPERGRIGIFSRSYYEEVLVVRVQKAILESAQLPDEIKYNPKIWDERLEDIRNYELYLSRNGVHFLKFFLLNSKDEQKKQLMERIEDEQKHWKFAAGDLRDRELWDDYMRAYEKAFAATSTKHAPWYVVPGNKRWFTRLTIAEIIADKLESMKLRFPAVSEKQRLEIAEAKHILENEK